MSALAIPLRWDGNLDELVEAANQRLPLILPLSKGGRAKEDINARLVRYYATQRLLDEPLKQGREARYARRHLLQLLALRRLMTLGHGTASLQKLLRSASDDELEGLATGQTQLDMQPRNPALAYLDDLKGQTVFAAAAPAGRAALPAAPQVTVPEPYTRLSLAPGIELHVHRSARLPDSKLEQDRLARSLLDALDTLRSRP